jgi:hypothetical protein
VFFWALGAVFLVAFFGWFAFLVVGCVFLVVGCVFLGARGETGQNHVKLRKKHIQTWENQSLNNGV